MCVFDQCEDNWFTLRPVLHHLRGDVGYYFESILFTAVISVLESFDVKVAGIVSGQSWSVYKTYL